MSESRLHIRFSPAHLDAIISIQARSETVDEKSGESLITYSTSNTVFALVESMTGDEMKVNEVLYTKKLLKMTIRYISNITVLHRVIFNNQYYNILNIDEIGRQRYQVLTCELISVLS